MRKYLLNANGKEAGRWSGKLRQAALQAPEDCGCVAETNHRFVFCSNGRMTGAQGLVVLDKMDERKRVSLHNLKPRQRERRDGTRTWGDTCGIKIHRTYLSVQVTHVNPRRTVKEAREDE